VPLPTEFAHCINDDSVLEMPLSAVDPFMALHFHFGMLLGVIDFEAQQAYHRGKSRLHNAWLHGGGVIWGLRVTVDRAANEVRVDRGLALDRAGHELYLEAPACVDLGAWYALHEKDPDVMPEVDDHMAGVRTCKAYVIARFRACLTREVPALSEPCEGGNTDTAFSRVAETIQLDLRVGDPPDPPRPDYECTRIFLGLLDPRLGDNDGTQADRKAAADERARVSTLSASDQRIATAAALQRFITIDAMNRMPAADDAGDRLLFPARDDEGIILGAIDGIELRQQGSGGWILSSDPAVSFDRRDTLVPTSELQFLLEPIRGAAAAAAVLAGPRIVSWDIKDKTAVVLTADKALDAGAAEVGTAFSVTSKTVDGHWSNHTFKATLGADKKTVTLKLNSQLPAGSLVRLIASGTGMHPMLGADGALLGAPVADAADGRDFVGMKKRS
jgi:hypothetical protein